MTASQRRLYLDYNATAPLLEEARDALLSALEAANPSSVHSEGRHARALVEDARRAVARLLSCDPANLVFTSGASEAAMTALTPRWLIDGRETAIQKLAVIDTDHHCIREGGSFAADQVTRLPVDANGIVDCEALAAWVVGLGEDNVGQLALTLANSETGVLQPLDRIHAAIAGRPVRLVIDAVQAVGRIPIDLAETGADVLLVSGHKLGAAKGVGALVLRHSTTRPFPLMRGGGQETGRRAGTEPVPAIASFGVAADVARERIIESMPHKLATLRRHLEAAIRKALPGAVVLGAEAERLPNTVAIAAPGLRSETAQMALDLAGIAISAGSACSSGKVGRSHVVAAMVSAGLAISAEEGAIRVSFGYETSADDLDRFVREYAGLANRVTLAHRQDHAA
ncbi:cysteine desulfurase family protein [Aurantimonas marina]|uniref:cysteine desulfurase family protein n=1 Tax=Aurantimonas marina TaxID=2780508 RepID=UPI0019CF7D15|nr:cysteine desulfurase family protein [Aurantimonas marina]